MHLDMSHVWSSTFQQWLSLFHVSLQVLLDISNTAEREVQDTLSTRMDMEVAPGSEVHMHMMCSFFGTCMQHISWIGY